MINVNQLVELFDGTNYVVLDKSNYDNNNYLYVAKVDENMNSTGDFDIVLETIVDGVPVLDYVKDEELYENLKLMFVDKDSNI
jgi:hypothetical protein